MTEQAIFSPPADALDEQPTSVTHFGQTLETELQRFFKARGSSAAKRRPLLSSTMSSLSMPFHVRRAPAADPALKLIMPRRQTRRPFDPCPRSAHRPSTRLLDLTDRGLMSHRRETLSSQADDRSEGAGYSWNLSTVFGAAVVAARWLSPRDPRSRIAPAAGGCPDGWAPSDRPGAKPDCHPAEVDSH